MSMVLNTSTNSITPQYHVVIDDWFTTSTSADVPKSVLENWGSLFPTGLLSTPTDDPDDFIADEWLVEEELMHRHNLRSPLLPARSPLTTALPQRETTATASPQRKTTATPQQLHEPQPTLVQLQPSMEPPLHSPTPAPQRESSVEVVVRESQ